MSDPAHGADDAGLLDFLVAGFRPGDAELRRLFAHDLAAEVPPAERVRVVRAGRLAAALLVFRRDLRVGRAVVPTACIGAVTSDPARRGQGLGAEVMAAAHARIRALGLPWVFLIGIDGFYHRLGYRSCLAEETVSAPLPDDRADGGAPAGGEAATAADHAAIDDLHHAAIGAGAWQRRRGPGDLARQLARLGPSAASLRVLRRGRTVAAYHLRVGGRLLEAGAADGPAARWVWDDASAALGAEIAAGAAPAAPRELALIAPAGHPCRRILAGTPHRVERRMKADGLYLGLLLDVAAFVAAYAPELEARAAARGLGGVDLDIDGRRHVVGAGRGPRAAVALGAGDLAQLAGGAVEPADLPGIVGDPDHLCALFPPRGSAFSPLESF